MKKNIFIILFILQSIPFALAKCTDPVNCLEEVSEVAANGPIKTGCDGEEEQTDKTKLVLDKNWWKYLLGGVAMAPPAFILGTAIHEGSHCLAAEVNGFDCFDVRVIPFYDEENDYFYFGRMSYSWEEGDPPTAGQQALITAAPMFTNASLITVYSTLSFADALPKNKWAKTAFFVLGTTQVIDLFNHVQNTHPMSDSGKLISYMENEHGLSSSGAYWAVKGPQIGFATLGTAALIVEGVRLFTNDVPDKSSHNIRIIPSVSPTGGMLSVSGKF